MFQGVKSSMYISSIFKQQDNGAAHSIPLAAIDLGLASLH